MDAIITRNELVTNYIAAWNETDNAKRTTIVAGMFEPDGTYTDPLFAVAGLEAFVGLIDGFQQQYPGLQFVQTGEVEEHHNLMRFTWNLESVTGDVIARGTDVALLSPNERIAGVAGFFDQAPVLG